MSRHLLRVSQLTPEALSWLERRLPARPLHLFQDVCNLIDESGSVLSIQTDHLKPGPNCLVIPARGWGDLGFRRHIRMDAGISHRAGQLQVGDLILEWGEAMRWDPRPDWESLRLSRSHWKSSLVKLGHLALSDGPAGGLSLLLEREAQDLHSAPLAARFVEAARPHTNSLLHAVSEWEDSRAQRAAEALAGLGGGLTPSGDDYLVGVMHALWCSVPEGEAHRRSQVLSQAAAPRTTPLSAEWLLAAARGEAGGNWHELFGSLQKGDADELRRSTWELLQVGHSSGADALTGFLQVLMP